MFLKVVYNDTFGKIFRVFEITALKSGWFGAPIPCDFGPFRGLVKVPHSLVKSDFA